MKALQHQSKPICRTKGVIPSANNRERAMKLHPFCATYIIVTVPAC